MMQKRRSVEGERILSLQQSLGRVTALDVVFAEKLWTARCGNGR
jgi:hypothetical protein